MKSKTVLTFILLMLVITTLAACGKAAPGSKPTLAPTEPPAATTAAPIETAAPTEAATASPDAEVNALPPDPRIVTITTKDNYTLTGYYYPASVNPAPLVVLMHWAGGDRNDWNEIAVWLQNRGLQNPFPNPGSDPWWDPTWFPAVPAGRSYAVLTFSFRGCKPSNQGGCAKIDKSGFLADIEGVVHKVHGLEGIDPNRIVMIGSSIGADGAVYGCAFYDDQYAESCQGALSLSPGNYLGVSYFTMVGKLKDNDPPTPAWCLADENEYNTCESGAEINNPVFKGLLIKGGGHGNNLLRPGLDPLPMQLILDFLGETLK